MTQCAGEGERKWREMWIPVPQALTALVAAELGSAAPALVVEDGHGGLVLGALLPHPLLFH